jgi:hypothetical protein
MFLIAVISACSPVVPTAQESTSQAKPTATVHPLTTRTGIAEIDRVLEASGDVQKLRSLVQFTSTKCTRLDGLGGPPKCRSGEGEGALVDVLPFLGPEGSFLRKDELRNWQGFEAAGIFAIYEVSPDAFSDENYPSGQYAILFVGQEKQPAVSLRVRDGKIVRVDYLFDDSPESLLATLQREADRLILAPMA